MSKIGSERAVIVKLIGGLGNQMFQYALGRSISNHLNGELWLDVTALEKSSRKYELGALSILENFATRDVMQFFSPPVTIVSKLGHLLKINRRWPDHYFQEKHFSYHHEVFELALPLYLEGYWQSPRYFQNIADKLAAEFRVKKPLYGENIKFAEQIQSCNSVSIHVRRGDYISNPHSNDVHGVCSLEYYYRAMKWIASQCTKPKFFIFSDEPEWTEKHFSHDCSVVVAVNSVAEPAEDLRLMRLCKHHIIANSSFSWWGAWLGEYPCKIVVVPQKWFRKDEIDTIDLIPSTWIRL